MITVLKIFTDITNFNRYYYKQLTFVVLENQLETDFFFTIYFYLDVELMPNPLEALDIVITK